LTARLAEAGADLIISAMTDLPATVAELARMKGRR
jgi:hypothetical protein